MCGLQYSCTWGKDTPTDNTRSPNLLKRNRGCIYYSTEPLEENYRDATTLVLNILKPQQDLSQRAPEIQKTESKEDRRVEKERLK